MKTSSLKFHFNLCISCCCDSYLADQNIPFLMEPKVSSQWSKSPYC